MAATKYNARDVIFQLLDPVGGTYVQINGLNTFTKGRDSKDVDVTTFASAGNAESEVMQRGKSMKLQGFRLKDAATGALDPGQLLVENLADQVGDPSVGTFRFAAPGDATYEVWQVTAVMGDEGGADNDKVSWSVTLTRTGASSTAARP
jgi:predicted secreted protein